MKIDFTKGIHTNTKPVKTPVGHYRDAKNMRISGQSKRTEEGTETMFMVPSDIVQWGSCTIGEESIILGTLDGKSVIGSLNRQNVWTMEVPARPGIDVLGIVDPTQVEGKKNWAGERIIYFSTPSGSRRINLDQNLPTDDTAFDKVTALFLEYDLPNPEYVGESNTGQLESGVYQAYVRLVTDSLASTPFGAASGIVPVVQQSLNSPRDTVDGDPPQTTTTKAINFTISNVDTAFKYIEVGILTYIGLSNTPVVYTTSLVLINGRSSIDYTYRGAPDNTGTLSVNEVIASGIAYDTGKFLTQKDGSLLIGAPTEADLPDIDWFRVAAGITAKYTIKRLPYTENLEFDIIQEYQDNGPYAVETSTEDMDNGYRNPHTCAKFKGYRRNEVYSLTLTPVFTNGVLGPTVHIPGNHAVTTDPTNTDADPNNGGTLGTYLSQETYPDDRYAGLIGEPLRLHKMPDAVLQPIIEGSVEDQTCFIRVLGIEFSDVVLDPSEVHLSDKVAGIIFGRVDRRGNETQLAQGIVRNTLDYQYNNEVQGQTTMLGDGFVEWMLDLADGGTASQCKTLLNTLNPKDFTFLSPDLIHKTHFANQASHIMQHSVYLANPHAIVMTFYHGGSGALPPRDEFSRDRPFFTNVTGDNTGQFIDTSQMELDGIITEVQAFGVPNAPQAEGGKVQRNFLRGTNKVELCSTNGFAWLGTKLPLPYFKTYVSEYLAKSKGAESDAEDWWFGNRAIVPSYRRAFVVHSLTRFDTKQYGALDQMVSMYAHYEPWAGFTGTTEFYNGDTFITKYGMNIGDESPFPYNTQDDSNSPNKSGTLKPVGATGITYFWIESDNNYNYRHFVPSSVYGEEELESGTGTVPYYPAYKQLANSQTPFGLLTMHAPNWQRPGYAKEYNTQYSTQPTLKPYAITPKEDTERRSALVNRIIFSATAVQGEKADAYQIFLPNNFYDVPQEYGELTDVYTNMELYASTAQVQWKLFYNTLVSQATSVGEVVLGTGGAFNRPGVPMTTVDGGYGGNTHWRHAINTVFGRVFIDKRQGKLFIMTSNLAEFSSNLDDRFRIDLQAMNDALIFVGSEPLRERVLFNFSGSVLSYNLQHKAFVSYHSYTPRWFFTHGPHMYSNQTDQSKGETGIFKHSLGFAGTYYGVRYESSITLAANAGNSISKLFRNIELITERTTEKGANIPNYTFTGMEVWNDERYSGLNTITRKTNAFQTTAPLELLSSKVKDCFRLFIPRDIVIDPESDIFALNNHSQHQGDTILTKWLPRMRGTYIEIKLITDNVQGPLFLHEATVDGDENIR